MNPITVILVDDHDVVRTGLHSYLNTHSDINVVAEARNGEETLLRAGEMRPDLIIMDITMPGMDGLEATRRLKMQNPECLVLALTVHEDKQYFMEMLSAGASGYITKQAAADDLVAAIRAVASGQVYLQPTLARWLLEDYQRLAKEAAPQAKPAENGDPVVGLDILSKREREVLELVGQAWNNQQIGEHLSLSPKTIARHRERIMHKLNMHSRTELVRFAIRTGLISA
jgi:two-component system response regulator NreC